MDQRADDIRRDIAHSRAAMTGKLALLEERLLETVAGAQVSVEKIVEDVGGIVKNVKGTVENVGGIVKNVKGTVENVGGIVENVKGTVQEVRSTVTTTLEAVNQGVTNTQASVAEMVEHVKDTFEETTTMVQHTFDLPAQIEQHPWSMVGGALLAGYVLGRWSEDQSSAVGSPRDTPGVETSRPGNLPIALGSAPRPQAQPGKVSGMLGQLQDAMQDEIASLKDVAVGAVISTLRAMFKQAIPLLAPYMENAMSKPNGPPRKDPAPQPAATSGAPLNGVPS